MREARSPEPTGTRSRRAPLYFSICECSGVLTDSTTTEKRSGRPFRYSVSRRDMPEGPGMTSKLHSRSLGRSLKRAEGYPPLALGVMGRRVAAGTEGRGNAAGGGGG